MQLLIEDVRSFRGKHKILIRPLTLLVGENSAGKTTLLSMISAVFNNKFPARSLFNQAPYDLGTFDTIASNAGGRWRSDSFAIGFFEGEGDKQREVRAVFKEIYGQPKLSEFCSKNSKGSINLQMNDTELCGELIVSEERELKISFNREMKFSSEIEISLMAIFPMIHEKLLKLIETERAKNEKGKFVLNSVVELLSNLLNPAGKSAISIAPVRTKPRRTYDELIEDFNPEGNHIPLILARALEKTETTKKLMLLAALRKFGIESGLYKDIEIKRLGKRPSDPFQVRVKGTGPARNLTDVGYGVSQSLPVIVESVLRSKTETMLLQQPEVHLHPRAQAALGTFLSDLVATQKKTFIVETHSDYLLDRVRQEVAAGNLKAQDVIILFLDKDGSDTKVHPIELDPSGNVINAPKEYRSFFLEEEMNLILRGKK